MYNDVIKAKIQSSIDEILEGTYEVGDIANFVLIGGEGEDNLDCLGGPCHASMICGEREEEDYATILNFQETEDTARGLRFQEWLIKRSPWACMFDANEMVLEDVPTYNDQSRAGIFTTVDVSLPSGFLLGGFTTSRDILEYENRVKDMFYMVDAFGVPENLAYLLTYCTQRTDGAIKLVEAYESGHSAISITHVTGKYLVEFLNATPSFDGLLSWSDECRVFDGQARKSCHGWWWDQQDDEMDMFKIFKQAAVVERVNVKTPFGDFRQVDKIDMEKTLPVLYTKLGELGVEL
jgi:hypothetical protein